MPREPVGGHSSLADVCQPVAVLKAEFRHVDVVAEATSRFASRGLPMADVSSGPEARERPGALISDHLRIFDTLRLRIENRPER
jgi:hypothetical protein